MTVATITLSSKGQVVIPREIREELRWEPGAQLTVISTPSGVTIKALPKRTTRNLADLIGMLKVDDPALSTEDVCKPVELAEDDSRNSVA